VNDSPTEDLPFYFGHAIHCHLTLVLLHLGRLLQDSPYFSPMTSVIVVIVVIVVSLSFSHAGFPYPCHVFDLSFLSKVNTHAADPQSVSRRHVLRLLLRSTHADG